MTLVFVVGVPRSGTTLLARELARTLPARALPELHVWNSIVVRRPWTALRPRSGADWEEDLARSAGGPLPSWCAELLRDQPPMTVFGLWRVLQDTPFHVVAQTPRNLRWLALLLETVPGCKAVVVDRTPEATFNSARHTPFGRSGPAGHAVRHRLDSAVTRRLSESFSGLRVLRVRFEDLLADPDRLLRMLAVHLDLDSGAAGAAVADEASLGFEWEHWKGDIARPIDATRADSWLTEIPSEDLFSFGRAMHRPLILQFGVRDVRAVVRASMIDRVVSTLLKPFGRREVSERSRIAAFPGRSYRTASPYAALFADALELEGHRVVEARPWHLIRRPDGLHIHWTERLVRGRRPVVRRLSASVAIGALRHLVNRGTRISWTVHNLRPHLAAQRDEHARRVNDFLWDNAAVIHHMSFASRDALRELHPRPTPACEVVSPQGHYPPEIIRAATPAGTRLRVGLVGRRREGKDASRQVLAELASIENVEVIVESGSWAADVAGSAQRDGHDAIRMVDAAAMDDFDALIEELDVAFVSYTAHTFNSGLINHALSRGTSVVAQANPVLEEIAGDVPWLHPVADEQEALAVVSRLAREHRPGGAAQLACRERWAIAFTGLSSWRHTARSLSRALGLS